MSKHTPGPWDFSWEIQPNGCPTVGHKGLMICMVAHSAKDPEQRETAMANASLIAAAPDLLDALEGCLQALRAYSPECGQAMMAKAAITKAKGESA